MLTSPHAHTGVDVASIEETTVAVTRIPQTRVYVSGVKTAEVVVASVGAQVAGAGVMRPVLVPFQDPVLTLSPAFLNPVFAVPEFPKPTLPVPEEQTTLLRCRSSRKPMFPLPGGPPMT